MPDITDLIAYLDGIEEHVKPTDVCLADFDSLYDAATENLPILLDVITAFVATCLGG